MDLSSSLVKDFFDLSKNVKKVSIQSGAVMGHEAQLPDFHVQSRLPSRVAAGQDYAQEYVEKEVRSLLKDEDDDDVTGLDSEISSLSISQRSKHNLNEMEDLTSVGSVANLADVENDDWSRIYKNYSFAPPCRKSLPIDNRRESIVRMIETNQVVIIDGPTGCGKTTQVPQYILDDCAHRNKRCNIIVTQPRRLAAVSVARRVCEERSWELSTIVGYQIGMENKTTQDTLLTFCTAGILREKLVKLRSMMNFTHIILDEVHERDIEMDFLMLLVRKLLRTNSRTVKVILMSATISTKRFAEYFASPMNNKLDDAPVVTVDPSSRSFKVHPHYLDELEAIGPLPDIAYESPTIDSANFDVAVRLIKQFDSIERQQYYHDLKKEPEKLPEKHAVLVFLPGLHEIEELYSRLERIREKGKYKWHVIPLHSTITREEQRGVFQLAASGYRKVILSTNIAESSITVTDVGYVIDFCLTKHLVCDPETNFTCLQLTWASKSNCIQRKGRAGRTKGGRVYRMVPKSFYETLSDDCDPEMLRCPLEQTVLKAKLLKMGNPKAILALAMDPPDLSRLEATMLTLKETGAMLRTCEGQASKFDGDLTFLGYVMAHLPLDIHLTKLIMLGHVFSLLDDFIIMAALMSVRNVFSYSFHDRLSAYGAKLGYADGSNSDCVAYLHLYKMFKEKFRTNYFRNTNPTKDTFFKRQFLNPKALNEANETVEELRKRLQGLGILQTTAHGSVSWDAHTLPIIRKIVMAGAFYPNYFVRGSQGGQVDERDAVKLLSGKDPKNAVYLQGMPSNQPGELYSKAVKKALEVCGSVSSVSFDGSSKVFVEFERSRNEAFRGKISLAVYRAVRMRQLRMPVIIHCLKTEEAFSRMEKLGLESSRLVAMGDKKTPAVKSYLPPLEIECIEFSPCSVEHPNRFWIHTSVSSELQWIQEVLNEPGNTTMPGHIKIGHIYAVPFPITEQILFRAQICKTGNEKATVLYIDYGNVAEEVPFKYIYEITPVLATNMDILSIPPLALECTLAGVAPSHFTNDEWSFEAKKKFLDLMRFPKMFGEVYSVVDGLVSLNIQSSDMNLTVNDILVKEEYAIRVEESYRSKEDNKLRELARSYNYSGEVQKNFEKLQPQQNFGRKVEDPEPPSEKDKTFLVQLRGPTSPLEMKVYGCTQIAAGKEVSINLDSVNAALLDNDPEDPHERLLVSASIGQNSSGSRLQLTHTTLMPNLHGLAALISLIFAPTIELRRNPDHSAYSGALCGLGCDEKTSQPYFPEHDMEMVFDCKFDLKNDMIDINKLRYWMSIPLEASDNGDGLKATLHDTLTSQQRVKELLLKLLQRPRDSQEVSIFRRPFLWNQFDEKHLLVPGVEDRAAVYQPHCALAVDDEEWCLFNPHHIAQVCTLPMQQ